MSASQAEQIEIGSKMIAVGVHLLSEKTGEPTGLLPISATVSCLMRYCENSGHDFDGIIERARKNGSASIREISERREQARIK